MEAPGTEPDPEQSEPEQSVPEKSLVRRIRDAVRESESPPILVGTVLVGAAAVALVVIIVSS